MFKKPTLPSDTCTPHPRPLDEQWFVVMTRDSGKFDDGYYGWDGNLHSACQIHRGDELPYIECDDLARIWVGDGEKPSLDTAIQRVNDWLEWHQPDATNDPAP